MLTNQRVLKIHADEDAKMEKHKQQTKQQQQKSSLKYKLEVDNGKEKKKRPGQVGAFASLQHWQWLKRTEGCLREPWMLLATVSSNMGYVKNVPFPHWVCLFSFEITL